MTKSAITLAALQYGDSFFPSGATSFSWGLETLVTEKIISNAADVEMFIRAQLEGRWASFDRGVVAAAYKNADKIDEVCQIDSLVEAQTLASEIRDGSHRSGLALLQVHVKLGSPRAESYRKLIHASEAFGNLTVMQGFLWADTEMSIGDTEVLSAHTMCVGLLGAAVRLGVIGHVDAQRILRTLHPTINKLIEEPPPQLAKLTAFTPIAEIAIMRHEMADSRLFAN